MPKIQMTHAHSPRDDAIVATSTAMPPAPAGPLTGPPTGLLPKKCKFAAATVAKTVASLMKKLVADIEKRAKLLSES